MSELPPILPESNPEGFVAYPRGQQGPNPEHLRLALKAYLLAPHSLWSILVVLIGGLLALALKNQETLGLIVYFVFYIVYFVFYAAALVWSLFFAAKAGIALGEAMGWSRTGSLILGISMGILGLIGLVILQSLALQKIKEFGWRPGCFRTLNRKSAQQFYSQTLLANGLPDQKLQIWP